MRQPAVTPRRQQAQQTIGAREVDGELAVVAATPRRPPLGERLEVARHVRLVEVAGVERDVDQPIPIRRVEPLQQRR